VPAHSNTNLQLSLTGSCWIFFRLIFD